MAENEKSLDEILDLTLDDLTLSRGERKALRQLFEDRAPDRNEVRRIRAEIFSRAHSALGDATSGAVLDWVKDVEGLLLEFLDGGAEPATEVIFSPGGDPVGRLRSLIKSASQTIEVAVYTLTDDRITREIEAAHDREVEVRILTDEEKIDDPGNDIVRLREAGVPVACDNSGDQMHHKFAVFDRRTAVTGSYNWTRSAAEHNQENLVITDDPRIVRPLLDEFERLWADFA